MTWRREQNVRSADDTKIMEGMYINDMSIEQEKMDWEIDQNLTNGVQC